MSTKPDVYEVIAALALAGVAHDAVNWPTYAHDTQRVLRSRDERSNFETEVIQTKEKYDAGAAILNAYGLIFRVEPSFTVVSRLGTARAPSAASACVWFVVYPNEFAPLPEKVNNEHQA